MTLSDIFTSETAVKVFYTYLAVTLGHSGVEAAGALKPDVVTEKVIQIEKRVEKIEGLVIELIKANK